MLRRKCFTLLSLLVMFAMLLGAWQPVLAQESPPTPEPLGLRPDAPEYARHGPYWVGYRPMIIGEETKHPVEAGLWYPALNPEGLKEDVVYSTTLKIPVDGIDGPLPVYGRALPAAAIDLAGAPYPLAVFSHGFSSNAAWYSNIIEHLASQGFVVLAPDHVEQFDPEWSEIPNASIDRPLDIKQVLDAAEAMTAPDGELAGFIDMENVAVAGHSYGGYTALAMAGAQYDLEAFNDRCAALAPDDPNMFLCAPLVPKEADMAARAGLDPMPEGLWPSFGDVRVKAIVPIAGDSYLFDQAGLAKITVPMMAIGGTADTGTPYNWGSKPSYDYVSSARKALVTLEGAEHTITTKCEGMPWMAATPFGLWICYDPVWDKDRGIDLINHFTTAFLLAELKGDAEATAALAPENVAFPGIEYSSKGYAVAEAASMETPNSISGFAENNGVRIHYEVEGQGPPLVLVHWASGSSQDWRMFGYADALKDKYRLILVDMRGHGQSDKPHDPAAYAAATQASDIVAVLDDLGIDKANYYGYSLGGRLGWAMAKYAPERLQSLIIGGHIPVVWDDSDWATWMLDTGVDAWALNIEDFARGMNKWSSEILPAYSANDLEAVALASHGLNSEDLTTTLPDLQIPVLLLAGTNDDMYPGMEAAAQRLPNAQMVSLVGLDHGQGYMAIDQVIPPITEFLAEGNVEAPAPPTATDIRSALAVANDTFMATYAAGDAAGMAALYTEDGQLLPPNADFVAGKDAIQQFWQSLMDEGITRVKLEIVEANAAGDTAYEVSKYTTCAGDQVADEGKYIVIWKQSDGEWKLYRDIFNSSMPD